MELNQSHQKETKVVVRCIVAHDDSTINHFQNRIRPELNVDQARALILPHGIERVKKFNEHMVQMDALEETIALLFFKNMPFSKTSTVSIFHRKHTFKVYDIHYDNHEKSNSLIMKVFLHRLNS